MATDDLIRGIETAVEAAPDNLDLRMHLAQMLHERGATAHQDHPRALQHLERVLGERPDDVAALALAAQVADRVGDPRAPSWARLARALSGSVDDGDQSPDERSDSDEFAVLDDADGPAEAGESGEADDRQKMRLGGPTPEIGDMPDTVEDLVGMWDGDGEAPVEPELGEFGRPKMTLADVGGMHDVKERLQLSFLGPMQNPELAQAFSKSMSGGLLLWGPPGCGKTFLARAIAGELGANFYSIGLSDVLDMYIGQSEQNLTRIFDVARNNTPCLLFFDELDALGQKRTNLRASGAGLRGTINQFLAELDGADNRNDGVFVLGATNHPWDIDSALLRPGRFDRMMLVLPPDNEARISILEYHMRGRPTDGLDLAKVASVTDGFSGADLSLLCDASAELALAESLKKNKVMPVTMKHIKAARKGQAASTKPWLETARNYALYSNDSGQFDDLLAYLKRR